MTDDASHSISSDTAFPVPVVRLIIENDSGGILLLKRADGSYAEGMWCLPGGKVDYGETLVQAAAKELKEETNLVLVHSEFLLFQESLPIKHGLMHCINFYYHCTASGNIKLNSESVDLSWVTVDTIGNYDIAFKNDEALCFYIKKYQLYKNL